MKLKAKNIEGEIIEFDVIGNEVNCLDKELTEIIYVPDNVKILDCSYNQLKSLPELPNVEYLNCSRNQLTCLPDLSNVEFLYCSNNELTSLPDLPKIEYLSCSNNEFGKDITIDNYKDVVKTNIDIDSIQIIEL